MRAPSIAELREREIPKLASFKADPPTQEDLNEARSMMRRFYRLCALAERNLYLTNDSRTCDLRSTKASEEKEERMWETLDGEFQRLYGLKLYYCGYAPSIVTEDEHGGVSERIQRFFY